MKTSLAALALGLASVALPATASATVAKQEEAAQPQVTLSKEAQGAIVALKEAVDAGNTAAIPGLYDAAIAASVRPDDVYYANVLKLQAGINTSDVKMQGEGLMGMAGSGWGDPAALAGDMLTVANSNLGEGNLAFAREMLIKVDELTPNNPSVAVLIGETYYQEDMPGEAATAFQKAIALQRASGQPVADNWYRRAIQTLQEADMAVPAPLLLGWAADHPNADVLGSSVRIYGRASGFSGKELIDLWRYQRAVEALKSEYEYASFADELFEAGYPGEALKVLEEGVAAGAIDANKQSMKDRLSRARSAASGDLDGIGSDAQAARSAAEATRAIATGDLYYGYDDFANAASLYEVALSKNGVDADLINLRLGAARARAGDFAGARAPLEGITGKYETLAKFWLAWIDSQG
ncbi:hypothetical protein [Sphingomicrobium aestuariivivum]|uniref:hypothetical protein n=1 Tax=Sphingomicrobium aestuariivivum TaxID=1582356 RepID=UPI001FD661BA|nr:hypothetical protein [Sphingomicrobium aestuariivivum]MCJ8189898.1 hypothetical protein [Sphingomicrobium aestuariivivum]